MRYYLKFNKSGSLIYTSHLDILRLFKRVFKRAGISPEYSQGFNPHPKMSFAQPLSLGYAGTGEYLEFQTKEAFGAEEILNKLTALMPEGLELIECKEMKPEGKTMAALTEKALYDIFIPAVAVKKGKGGVDIDNLVESFLAQEFIKAQKFQKKTGKETEMEIRPLIFDIKGTQISKNETSSVESKEIFAEINNLINLYYDKYIMLTVLLAAGSEQNLSPELFISTFSQFAEIECERHEIKVIRREIRLRGSFQK